MRRLPARKLDDAVVAILADLSRDPQLLLAAAERSDDAAGSELESATALREQRREDLASLDARLRNLIGIFGDGEPVPQALKDECVRLDGELRDLMLELERLGTHNNKTLSLLANSPTGSCLISSNVMV